MSNKVVLASDLGLYHGNDCLKLDGEAVVDLPLVTSLEGDAFEIKIPLNRLDVVHGGNVYLLSNGWYAGDMLRVFTTATELALAVFCDGVSCGTVFSYDFTQIHLRVDGGVVYFNDQQLSIGTFGADFTTHKLGKTTSWDPMAPIIVESISCVGKFSYIQQGDFGSLTLVDHSGNGNDATMSNTTWWKKGVDQHFITPLSYRTQLEIPPVEFQDVIDVDTNAPSVESGYYDPYDENWMRITRQSNIDIDFLISLLTEEKESSMSVRRVIEGSDLAGAGMVQLERVAKYIKATSEVTFDVVLIDDVDTMKATSITTLGNNLFYPSGSIAFVDNDVDLSTVSFGIA